MMPLSNLTIPGVGLAAIGSNAMSFLGQANELPPVLKNNTSNSASFASILDSQQTSSDVMSSTKNSISESSSSITKTEKQIRDAARGFERTLVRQMLSTVRSNSLRGGDDQNDSSKGYLEIADDKLADALVAGKGVGFASKVADQMLSQPNVKALIEAEKKSVSNTNKTNSSANFNNVVNQYKNVSSF